MTNMVPVAFDGDTLWAEPANSERKLVAVKPIVTNLGLDWVAQRRRIVRDDILAEGMVVMAIPSLGGEQQTLCLPLDMIPGFLAGIMSSRIPDPAVRAKVRRYRVECFRVLAKHFLRPEEVRPREAWDALAGAIPEPHNDDVSCVPHSERELRLRLDQVREARLTHRCAAGRALWRELGLPWVAEMDRPEAAAQGDDVHAIGDWLTARTEPVRGVITPAAVLWADYLAWCRTHGVAAATQARFGRRLPALGVGKVHGRTIAYRDIRLRDERSTGNVD